MFSYSNVGGKIKIFAKVIFALDTALMILLGFAILVLAEEGNTMGLFFIILGPVFSWLGSLVLYGFGELVERAAEIAHNTSGAYDARKPVKKIYCAKCGTEADYGTHFCSRCGTSFTQQQSSTKRSVELAEREAILNDMKRDNAQRGAEASEPPKSLPTVQINRFGDGMCPVCNNAVSFDGNVGISKCPRCQVELKIQKNG